ncbi:MAG: sulfatase [Limisphaerales bacterium]
MTDDLGINDLACYGRAEHRTPNLDQLAREGVRFTSAYCAQPICSPSRAALLTGKAPARLHITTFLPGRADAPSQKLLHPKIRQALPLEETTLAEHLKLSSRTPYVTGWIGKWHLGGKGFLPTDQGFDHYYPGTANTMPSATEGGKGEFDLTREAEKFLEQNQKKPFVLFLSHNTPHIVYTAKKELIDKNQHAFEPVYAALIESLDQSVGQLLHKIDALGLRENTIVIFTSDNGGLHVPEGRHQKVTHNRPFRAGKGFLYEGGLRIPLIVRWPGKIAPGSVNDTPVINTDWTPTLLEVAGHASNQQFDAISLLPLLTGETQRPNRKLFWHFPHYTNQGSSPGGAMREGSWKLIEHYEDGRMELFNLKDDLAEKNDLSKKESERAASMRAALHQWREAVQVQTNSLNPNFDPALHRPIYQEFDISRYDPHSATAQEFARVHEWRKQMNSAVRR